LLSQRSGAFEIGEMATVFERHQAGTGNGLRNVLGSEGKEVMVACDDERRDVQALELGMQVVAVGRGPRLIHQPVFDGLSPRTCSFGFGQLKALRGDENQLRNKPTRFVFPSINGRILDCNFLMRQGSIPSLDGLRAISIGMVILGHSCVPTSLWGRMLFSHAALGVRIFFVISGYLITHLLLEEIRRFGNVSLPLFYARRALRIFPAFLLFVAALVVLNHLAVIKLPPEDLLAVLTYTVNFRVGAAGTPGIFGPSQ